MEGQCWMCLSTMDSAGKCTNLECPSRKKERPVNTEYTFGWKSVSQPPFIDGEYIVFTNYDDVYILDFKGGKWITEGCRFNKGEKPAYWISTPKEAS